MELHVQLRSMVERLGPHALADADEFRAALDDFLPEAATTNAEFNLLVDTVRLDAFDRLGRLVADGAPPAAAVADVGDRLAADRGSPQNAARWACAVLGYAAGWIPGSEVTRYARPAATRPTAPAANRSHVLRTERDESAGGRPHDDDRAAGVRALVG